jgi:uncharacterized glyoxalase superfamily protein PhnB
MTPILYVDGIEPCLDFWTKRLGFTRTVDVPHGDRLGFVILLKDGIELMYQTWASAEADIPGLLKKTAARSAALFIEVEDIDAVERAMTGVDVAHPRRKTFYGATEFYVREPGGHIVGFAQMER